MYRDLPNMNRSIQPITQGLWKLLLSSLCLYFFYLQTYFIAYLTLLFNLLGLTLQGSSSETNPGSKGRPAYR